MGSASDKLNFSKMATGKVCFALVIAIAVVAGKVTVEPKAGGCNQAIPVAPESYPHDMCGSVAKLSEDKRMEVFTYGFDNAYWYKKQTGVGGGFGNWTSLGGIFAGGPSVTKNADGHTVIFGRGIDKAVWYKTLLPGGKATPWTSLGGDTSSRAVPLLDSQGLLHVFARGSNRAIWHKYQVANGTHASWGQWHNLGGVVTSAPQVVLDAESLIHVFSRGIDRALWHKQQAAVNGTFGWSNWESLGAVVSSGPYVPTVMNCQNFIEIFIRGSDKGVWHKRQTINDYRGITWSPWKPLGGVFASAPVVIMNGDGLLDVFGRGPDKAVWHKVQGHHPVDSPSDTWTHWGSIGGKVSTAPSLAIDFSGMVHVFTRGIDKSIWHTTQAPVNNTAAFGLPWETLGGRFRTFSC